MKIVPLKITSVVNSNKVEGEFVRLRASVAMNTANYALVDRTFDTDGNVSNEFRHIYVFPPIDLSAGEEVIVHSGKGKDGKIKYSDSEGKYHRLFWGANDCVWNDEGGDKATLIKFEVINTVTVPPVEKK